jgi:DNA invertase Pin-like site-specific DNA recombinase
LYDTRVASWHKLPALRVALRVLDLNLDTTTATGRSLFTMIGAIAAFEREMMLERQREGIAKAKAEGRYAGRKPTIDPAAVTALRAEGLGARKRQPSSNVDRRVNSSATKFGPQFSLV